MFHFTLLSTTVWFCCSVFNVTAAVLTFSTDNVIKRHARAVFVIQCLLAVAVPGGLVGYVLGTSSYYFWPLTFTCMTASVPAFFFTGVLPAQIVCVCTTIMVILIVRRLRQVCMCITLFTNYNKYCSSYSIVSYLYFRSVSNS